MSADRILLTVVRNPFDPHGSRDVREAPHTGGPLRDYVAEAWPLAPSGFRFVASVSGAVTEDLDAPVPAGAGVTLCPVPGDFGGGDGGKDSGRTIAMLAVMVAAIAVAAMTQQWWIAKFGADATIGAGIAAGLAGAAVGIGGGMLVNAVMPLATPDLGGGLGVGLAAWDEKSPTYGWEVAANRAENGGALPVLYGTMRVAPYLIAKHVTTDGEKQFLNLLYAVAEGPLDAVTGVEINGEPAARFDGVSVDVRLGTHGQTVIPSFADTIYEGPVGVKLSPDHVARSTDGNASQSLGVGLVFPAGLYYVADGGALSDLVVDLEIEYRAAGAADWLNFAGTTVRGRRFQADRDMSALLAAGATVKFRVTPDEWATERYIVGYDQECSTQPIWAERRYQTAWATYLTATVEAVAGNLVTLTTPAARAYLVNGATIYSAAGAALGAVVQQVGDFTVSDARRSPVRRCWRMDGLAAGEYEVRIRRSGDPHRPGETAAPSVPTRYQADCYWEYLQEAVPDDFAYPCTALLAIRALATDQLSGGLPRVTCLAARSTVRVWTGEEWVGQPATAPAWICWDMLWSPRYGGGVAEARINYAEFLAWAAHTDGLGIAGNVYFDTTMSLPAALNQAAQLGRGQVVQRGTQFGCIVDRPGERVQVFNVSNIVAGSFEEAWLDLEDRANLVEVTYFDAEKDYERTVLEVVQEGFDAGDEEARPASLVLYGCTSRAVAARHARFLLNCNRHLTRVVTFQADVDAIACQPGDVILVQHDVPQWGYGGRVEAATETSLTLGKTVPVGAGTHQVLVRHADDTLEERTVANAPGEASVLQVSPAWTATPAADDLWLFGPSLALGKLFRVTAVTRSGELRCKIVAAEYRAEVYADTGEIPDYPTESLLSPVRDLRAVESWRTNPDGSTGSVVSLAWRGEGISWGVFWRRQGGAWALAGRAEATRYDLAGLLPGNTYDIAVSTTTPDKGEVVAVPVLGKAAPPSDCENFVAWQDGQVVRFKWAHIPDSDLWGYEIRLATTGTSWTAATPAVDGVQENQAAWMPPVDGMYTFLLKALDETGNYSVNAASFTLAVDIEGGLNVVDSTDEFGLGCPGDRDGMVYLSGAGTVALLQGLTDTEMEALTDTDLAGLSDDSDREGAYTAAAVDLGRVCEFALRVGTAFDAELRQASDLSLNGFTDKDLDSDDTDTSITALAAYDVEYRYSTEDTATPSTWSDWARITSAVTLNARHYQVRWRASVQSSTTWFAFDALAHSADVPELDVRILSQSIGNTGTTFTFGSGALAGVEMFQEYVVGVTPLSANARSAGVVKNGAIGFTVHLYDKDGNGVADTADLSIRGF